MTTGVSTELGLEIDAALQSVDQLDAALGRTVESFAAQLAGAFTDLASPVPVTADASAVTEDINAAVGAADTQLSLFETVSVEADTSAMVDEIDGASAAATPVVTPELDSSKLESEASASGEKVGEALGSIGSAGGSAELSISGLSGALEQVAASSPEIAAVAGPILAVAAAGDKLFGAAVELESAQAKLDLTTHGLSKSYQELHVEGLGEFDNQVKLGEAYGATEASVDAINAKQAALIGSTRGLDESQKAQLASNLALISANAVATGTQTDYTTALDGSLKGLANYQRAGIAYGVSLSKQQVAEEQAKLGIGGTFAELDKVTKAYVVSQAAIDNMGPALEKNIVAGSQRADVSLKALQAQLQKTFEEGGKPLIAPTFDALRAAEPVIASVTLLLGKVVGLVLPLLTGLFDVLGPIADLITAIVSPAFEALAPVMQLAGDVGKALGISIKELTGWFNDLPGPIKAVVLPASGLLEVMRALGLSSTDAASTLKDADGNLVHLASSAEQAKAAVSGSSDEFAKLTFLSTGFAQAGVAEELRQTGVSAQQLQADVVAGDAGFKSFTASGIAAGKIEFTNTQTGAKLSADEVRKLKGNLDGFVTSGAIAVTGGNKLYDSFRNLSASAQAGAQATLQAKAATLGLNDADLAGIAAKAKATLGSSNYVAQLKILEQEEKAGTVVAHGATGATLDHAAAWLALASDLTHGRTSADAASASLQALGIDAKQADVGVKAIDDATSTFADTVASKMVSAQSVWDKLNKSTSLTDPGTYFYNLQQGTATNEAFSAQLQSIADKGGAHLAAFLGKQGPEAAGAFATSLLQSGDQAIKGWDDQQVAAQTSLDKITANTKAWAGDHLDATTTLAKDSTKAFGENLDFAGKTKADLDAARQALTDGTPAAADAAHASGVETGKALGTGATAGVQGEIPAAEQAARDLVARMEAAARAQAQAKSPSKLFADLGADLGAGVAQGLGGSAAQVVAEAEKIVRLAAAAVVPPPVKLPVAVPNLAGGQAPGQGEAGGFGGSNVRGGGVVIQQLTVTVPANASPEQVAKIGPAVADSIDSALARRQISAAARSL